MPRNRRPAQRLFAVILGRHEGARRFRTTVLAGDIDDAYEKAGLIAKQMLGFEVELVQPMGDDPSLVRAPSGGQDNMQAGC